MTKEKKNKTTLWHRLRLAFPRVRRNYKDALFIKLFHKKKDLLSLYNALNGTHYEDTRLLTITTIENAIFLSYKNDVSFIVGSFLNLYEHQSTICPNLPLRGLIYFATLYQKYVETNKLNLYGTTRLILPTPKYVIFYNGEDDQPDIQELRLTDSFAEPGACLECVAVMYNINHGHNAELLKRCSSLEGYAVLISLIRQYTEQGVTLEAAANKAIDYCIEHDYIKQFLLEQKGEVIHMLLTEYNPKKQRMMDIRDAKAEGHREGRNEGRNEGRIEGRNELKAELTRNLMESLHITESEAMQLLKIQEKETRL